MALTQEVSDELTKFVAQRFDSLPDFTDDSKEISEYIVLLIANGRTAEQTYNEVQDLISHDGLKDVILSAYKALEDHQNQQQQQQQQQQPPQPTQIQLPQSADSSSSGPDVSVTNGDQIVTDNDTFNHKAIPSKPAGFVSRSAFQRGGNAISKARGSGLNKNYALRNQEAFQKAINLSNTNGSSTFINARGQLKKKARCTKFPHCPNKDCLYAHPRKPCFQYPNCPNPPGTCVYLHPGEDDALVAEYEKVKQEHYAQRQNKIAQNQAGIALCKFGVICSNQQCPFGHPTPANEDQKVTTLEWCSENLKCSDPNCTKAHSSLSKIKEIKPLTKSTPSSNPHTQAPEKSLDPCKFGANCTNRFCKFRHASTATLCRDGEKCVRIDCFFSHPINEVCRFGEGCKNNKCLFQHPNGKAAPVEGAIPNKSSLTWTKTNERQFAVPDDQVLEQAPPQES